MRKEIKRNGRPRLYDSPEDFDDKVAEYKLHCKENKEPATWTGLALFLGFSSRQSIDEYLKYDGFSDSVKRAKMYIEHSYEKNLHNGAPSGSIFALKNFGWSDKNSLDLTSSDGTMTPTLIEIVAPDYQSQD